MPRALVTVPFRRRLRRVVARCRSGAPGSIRSAAPPPDFTDPGSLVGSLPDVLFPIVAD